MTASTSASSIIMVLTTAVTIMHTLLGIRDQETLLGHPVVGSSWEGTLIENMLSAVPANTQSEPRLT
jgi:hypothetical protein